MNDTMPLSYTGWEEDKTECEKLYVEFASLRYFHEKRKAMQHKQRLHDGDRSHPNVYLLDHHDFTYPGWQLDKKECLKRHTGDCSTIDLGRSAFQSSFNSMKKKQVVFRDRKSIACLRELDSLPLTFPHWEMHKRRAEEYYVQYDSPCVFNKKVAAMKNKQRIHEGDRSSDPDLQQLDSMKLTYAGWQSDVDKAMKGYTGDCFVLDLGLYSFRSLISTMRKKQQEHDNESSNACFEALDKLNLVYVGNEADRETAKRFYFEFDSKKPFFDKLRAMENKQRLHRGDRSHAEIQNLDRTNFSYEGFEADKDEAIRRHMGDCSILDLGSFALDAFFQKMQKKEAVAQRKRALFLQDLDNRMQRESSENSLPELTGSISSMVSSSSSSVEGNSSDNGQCVVCFENESSHAFIPCGHLVLCSGCTSHYDIQFARKEATCPMCRAPSVCVTKIFR